MIEPRIKQVTKAARDDLVSQVRERKREARRAARGAASTWESADAWVRDVGTVRMRRAVDARRPGAAEARERRVLEGMEAPDAAVEGAAGEGVAPRSVTAWSASLARFVVWRFDVLRERWTPAGVDAANALRLRVELRKAHGAASADVACEALAREVA